MSKQAACRRLSTQAPTAIGNEALGLFLGLVSLRRLLGELREPTAVEPQGPCAAGVGGGQHRAAVADRDAVLRIGEAHHRQRDADGTRRLAPRRATVVFGYFFSSACVPSVSLPACCAEAVWLQEMLQQRGVP